MLSHSHTETNSVRLLV